MGGAEVHVDAVFLAQVVLQRVRQKRLVREEREMLVHLSGRLTLVHHGRLQQRIRARAGFLPGAKNVFRGLAEHFPELLLREILRRLQLR